MKTNTYLGAVVTVIFFLTACSSHYQLSSISHQRIVIDKRFDANPDMQATAFLSPFKHVVDSVMGPVVGIAAHNMAADRPESDLSNLMADILIWASKDYNEHPAIGIYNIGGIRAALIRGEVTYGDIVNIAPFENKICFLTLTGENLLELFRQIAARYGEGVSHGTELVISTEGKLLSAKLNGKEIDPTAEYRVATIDYVAQGNDGMSAFKKGTNLISPQEESNNTRFILMNYFKMKAAKGESVSSKTEGRIVVKY